jgi:hypothetical protein
MYKGKGKKYPDLPPPGDILLNMILKVVCRWLTRTLEMHASWGKPGTLHPNKVTGDASGPEHGTAEQHRATVQLAALSPTPQECAAWRLLNNY